VLEDEKMKKTWIALLLALAMLLGMTGSALAQEDPIPQKVQAFHDELNAQLAGWGVTLPETEITIHTGVETYAMEFNAYLIPFAMPRSYYDVIYTWKVAEQLNISVAYIGDRPAAYIMDSNCLLMRGGLNPYLETMYVFCDAFDSLYPGERADFSGDILISDVLAYDDELIKQASTRYDDVFVSAFRYQGDGFLLPEIYSLQLLPLAAYEGLEMPVEDYHQMALGGLAASLQAYYGVISGAME